MSNIAELFGRSTDVHGENWSQILQVQQCPYLGKKCYKVRKSDPDTAIGSCIVRHGRLQETFVICPARLIDRRQIFVDCLHLLTVHEPGNDLHLVPEVTIPRGNVDYFLVSASNGKVRDFAGIELQALDTTGTIWPERQRLLRAFGLLGEIEAEIPRKPFGINWKMTAKTTLVQMLHKIHTFEHVNKKLVLVTQDKLLDYMTLNFSFAHLSSPPLASDSAHFHAYRVDQKGGDTYSLSLQSRMSTDANGIRECLGLQAESRVELELILAAIQEKLSASTLFAPV